MATYLLIGLLCLVLGGGIYVFFRIKNAVTAFSKNMFGTKNLIEGMKQQEEAYAGTPKSVAGMTSLYLPQIQKDFPEFNWAQFRQRVENLMKSSLTAMERQDLTLLSDASPDLRKQIQLQIDDCKRRQEREYYRKIQVHQTEISRYRKDQGTCVITLQSAVEYEHDAVSEGIAPNLTREQSRYETELVYIQDVDQMPDRESGMGITCTQCGAPIKNLGSRHCEYCGAAVVAFNIRVWALNRMIKTGN